MFVVDVRPLTADERQRLERWKQGESGRLLDGDTGNTVPYILSGAAALGLLGLQAGLTPWLKLGAAAWAGMSALGLRRLSAKHARRRGEAATRWEPVLEKGQVEVLRVKARAVVEWDDAEGGRAWFFDVGEGRVFVLWHDPYAGEPFPCSELRVTRVPDSPWVLDVVCLGAKLEPARPRRRLGRGQYAPAQCELLSASLDTLEQDLVRLKRERPEAPLDASAPASGEALSPRLRALVDGVEELGFYKYVTREDIPWVKDASRQGAGPWFLASLRAHAADAERLAEGGVGDLLQRVGEVLRAEGVELGEVQEHVEANGAYSLTLQGREHRVYSAREASRGAVWQLAQERALGLVNTLLQEAGSAERAWLMSGGEDGVLVFLTPELRAHLARHWPFPPEDLPREVKPRKVRSPRP